MAEKSAKAKSAEPLPAAGTAESGVPLHSFEAYRGPIDSKATDAKAAYGIEETATEAKKGKPVRVKSRVPRYSAHGKVFRSDDEGGVYWPDAFTPEQWASIRANPNLIVSKAVVSDE